jgi:tetratricopeptide (TPR) repeat protein
MTYFLNLGSAASLEDPPGMEWGIPREMKREADNFRAATRWALAGKNHETAVRLSTQLGWILVTLGQRREVDALLERVLNLCANAPHDVLSRAWFLRGWAVVWFISPNALAYGEEALRLAEAVGDERAAQAARVLMAQALLSAGDSARFESVTAEMQRSAQPGSFDHIFAFAVQAAQLMNAGELVQSKALFEEAAELSRASKDFGMLSTCQLHIADVCLLQGDFELARRFTEDAMESIRPTDVLDPRLPATMGLIDLFQGDYPAAKQWLEDALSLAGQQPDR